MADYQPAKRVEIDSGPPKAVDVLAAVFERVKKSDVIPERPNDAAHWWMDHQEPPNEITERVEQITTRIGETGWRTPYIDRVVATAKIFCSLDDPHRAFVINKIESGIPWRGDDMRMFLVICEQAEIMRRDPNAYRCSASAVLAGIKGAA